MKKIVRIACLAALVLGTAGVANAQFRQSVYLNLDLPTGGFASKVGSNGVLGTVSQVPLGYKEIGKEATAGFGLGYRASYRFDVGVGIVAPFAQADFFWNTISGSLSDAYTQARSKATPTYFNVPIQVGITYLYDELWNNIIPYGEFGLGADIMMITGEGPFTIAGVDMMKYGYKMNTAFSFSVGAGAYFGEHVSAGLYYYGLGKHTIEYNSSTYKDLGAIEKATYDSGNVETRTAGALVLRIGFHF